MPTYEYRCDADGTFEIHRPVGTAGPEAVCPTCTAAASRVFTAPMLSRSPRRVAAAIDRAERTREAPDVVAAPPPRGGVAARPSPVQQNPALRSLPRP